MEETRRRIEHHPDAFGRPTHTRWGVGPGSFASVAAFERDGKPMGLGLPFNEAPDFCGASAGIGPLSQLCAALEYDRADRLTRLTRWPDASTPQKTGFTYDAQGNVASIQDGCASAEGCTQPFSSYRYDDFGNLIEAQLPFMEGPVRYAHDARGNLLVKQTEAMRRAGEWLEYSYDLLSRPQETVRVGRQAPAREVLFRLGYDGDQTLPASCARPEGGPAELNSWGRLRFRDDSFTAMTRRTPSGRTARPRGLRLSRPSWKPASSMMGLGDWWRRATPISVASSIATARGPMPTVSQRWTCGCGRRTARVN